MGAKLLNDRSEKGLYCNDHDLRETYKRVVNHPGPAPLIEKGAHRHGHGKPPLGRGNKVDSSQVANRVAGKIHAANGQSLESSVTASGEAGNGDRNKSEAAAGLVSPGVETFENSGVKRPNPDSVGIVAGELVEGSHEHKRHRIENAA